MFTSKKKRDDTVQKLNEFDYSQTVSLNPVEQDIQTMDTWLTDLEGMFQSGLTDVHFQSSHWGILASRNTLKMELEARTSRIPGDTTVQPKNHDLTTMFYTFLTGASPLQFGSRGFIQKPNVLYGPSILGFASLPTHSPTKNINENMEHETSELDEIYAAILKSNPELAVDSPSTPQTYSANEPITYEGMRKVLGGNGSGTPDGLFAMGVGLSIAAKKGGEIAADELFLNDFQTLKDPNASRIDKSIALFSLTPMGKLKKAAEGVEEGKDFVEQVIDAQKKAEKAKDAKKSVGDVESSNTINDIKTDINSKFDGFDLNQASNKQKGNYGEYKAYDNLVNNESLKQAGYDLERIGNVAPTSPNDKIIKGIDRLNKNNNTNSAIKYVIDEAKFGTSQLGTTKLDGPQMSNDWLLGMGSGKSRIIKAVNGNEKLATEISDALENGQIERVLSKVNSKGETLTFRLDTEGKIVGTWP
ncbi:T7SS effector LXG polymorphic toxin [Psychrobacillus sp. FSL W7-1457]|uniref:T7SS effector LXG polymorphic toxin n=1 Tax=Psychrobacillus sp. FSL W7-1457 TaxID=2954547 RepID=UPI00315A25C6